MLRSVPTGGRVLQLPLVRVEDAGRYSCKASNEVGEDWLHYELLVLSEWLRAGGAGSLGPAGPRGRPLKGPRPCVSPAIPRALRGVTAGL